MVRFIVLVLSACFVLSCCTAGKGADTGMRPSAGGTAVEAAHESEAVQSPSALPVGLSVTGEPDGDTVVVRYVIEYRSVFPGETRVEVTPGAGTVLIEGTREETFGTPGESGSIERRIRIGGEIPSVGISVRMSGKGISAETRGMFPPEKLTRRAETVVTPLPVPVEVEGAVIGYGVEVLP